jgi:hypothetical protein
MVDAIDFGFVFEAGTFELPQRLIPRRLRGVCSASPLHDVLFTDRALLRELVEHGFLVKQLVQLNFCSKCLLARDVDIGPQNVNILLGFRELCLDLLDLVFVGPAIELE